MSSIAALSSSVSLRATPLVTRAPGGSRAARSASSRSPIVTKSMARVAIQGGAVSKQAPALAISAAPATASPAAAKAESTSTFEVWLDASPLDLSTLEGG